MGLELISVEPDEKRFETPLLFVHGAWHGAWCWAENFLPYFAGKGYSVHALSLRGHGGSSGRDKLRWARGSGYVADVHEVAEQLPTNPVIIAHSMGGYVAQKYLEKYKAPAAVLLAPVPDNGVLRTTLNIARHHPLDFLRVNLKLSLYPLVRTEALTKSFFFSADMPQEQVRRYYEKMQDESYLGFLDMLLLNLPRPKKVPKTPMLILGAANDAIFTPGEIARTARAYGADSEVFPDMAHDMMLEPGWQTVADRMTAWLEKHIS
ncbi:MAG: alpha/beta fold hydrolase [Candidatus Promineifilaceae bacterium]